VLLGPLPISKLGSISPGAAIAGTVANSNIIDMNKPLLKCRKADDILIRLDSPF
jgi:hypothetical protein